ncbi:TadE/TadG family type IV pilus assembly protein [Nocardioides sp. R-C-SC26]|uniref:TadE/TadG family type IV pilus assembly protein n=1 Tax=Nocardioides sp. R-C-SC26 TaxID=2870414 RepID=UPI001E46A9B3|nr:TadE/TadG family type IV pilus assembly protein [Nocardioides sp. R-C-SC26]
MRRREDRGAGRRRDNGAAALELALVAPLLAWLLFGILAYGYMLSFRQAVSVSAAQAARVYVTSASSTTAAYDSVSAALKSYDVTCSQGSLRRAGATVGTCSTTTRACGDGDLGQCVFVTVTYDYGAHPLLPVPGIGAILPDTLSYTASGKVPQ